MTGFLAVQVIDVLDVIDVSGENFAAFEFKCDARIVKEYKYFCDVVYMCFQ